MFGFFRKKGRLDNGDRSRAKEQPVPQSPWDRAADLMGRGQTAEALEQFARAAIQTRDASHMDMAERWLDDPALLERAGEAAVCRFVSVVTIAADGVEETRRGKILEQCLTALGRIQVSKPRPDGSDRYTVESNLLRRMGRPAEGLEAAKRGIAEHNSPSNYAFAAVCCLTLDDPEQAERYVRMGRKLEPTNLSTTNDLADYFLEHHSCADAARCYAEVVEESEDSADLEWAELSLIYCRWLMTRDPMELERLVLCAASYPGNPRGAQLCQLARSALE
ncbi:hypothetical protein D1646_05845 [Pseudoflavonifractor sp. 60]|uniref:hypothetical protein n=1 Tax=Pseudoflavonifractor sp. 60 TaxID=2304576 RepID=UPI0013715E23|nr:hypothetical protein [Pseudoflavonifractor sp. 60]NBI66338.1 hypothetical protein [Pseudoflavonifractor sp. 60]